MSSKLTPAQKHMREAINGLTRPDARVSDRWTYGMAYGFPYGTPKSWTPESDPFELEAQRRLERVERGEESPWWPIATPQQAV